MREFGRIFVLALAILSMLKGSISFAEDYDDLGKLTIMIKGLIDEKKYEEAIPLLEQAMELAGKEFGIEHKEFASAAGLLGRIHENFGDYAKAESLLKQALEIFEKTSPDSPVMAKILYSLASLYHTLGDYSKAENFYRRSLQIGEKTLGPENPDVGARLNGLATLYVSIGDYVKAESLFKRSLEICEQVLGPDHPDAAIVLHNLASLYRSRGDYTEAVPLCTRSLEILEKAFGPDHPNVAKGFANLAGLYRATGDYARAENLYRRSLEIREKALGPEHPDVATGLSDLALFYLLSEDYVKAESLCRRVVKIYQNALGPEHPSLSVVFNNLAYIYANLLKFENAVDSFSKATSIDQKNIDNVMGFTSDKQKLAYLADLTSRFDGFLSLLAKHLSANKESLRQGINALLMRKGIILEYQIRSNEAFVRGEDPQIVKTFAELKKIRTKIASLTFAGPGNEDPRIYRMKLQKLREEEEKLEAQLSRLSRRFALDKKVAEVDIHQIAKLLPKGSVLIEFARPCFYNIQANPGERWEQPHYFAFIFFADKGELKLIDLGEAEQIDEAIIEFRRELQQIGSLTKAIKTSLKQKASALYDLVFIPVRENLNGYRRLFISPEGSLNLIPFEALLQKNGRYLIEDYTISYVTAGRDLLRFGQEKTQEGEALVITAPDFDLKTKAKVKELKRLGIFEEPPSEERLLAKRSAETGSLYFPPLPGTEKEGEAISRILEDKLSLKAVLYTRQAALEEVLKEIKRPRVLHIATHGFFLRDEEIKPSGEGLRNSVLLSNQRAVPFEGFQNIEDPLLRSGLALAGANESLRNESREGDSEDGILTAAEVCGLNLQGTDLVVLSACETGIGEIQIGEGVFGLRRAFIQAGAQTLVTSLWRVSDESTVNLMEDFYKNLKTMDKAEALRQAQLKLMKSGTKKVSQRGVSGISKAEGKGQPLDTSHPYFWAPFILIGDWK